MKYLLRSGKAAAAAIVAGLWLLPAATAQTTYENYTFVTLAGPAESAASYDGTNSAARFGYPYQIAEDSAGNFYVADNGDDTIRKISPTGTVTTLAGLSRTPGTNDGTGALARFNQPDGIAVDKNGTVYVADTGNHAIRKITPAGMVTTLAGLPGTSGSLNATGTAARFNTPGGVAVDSNTNVYVADSGNSMIRKITPAGVVSTLAGLADIAGTNNGTGTGARFNAPFGVAVDKGGNVYVADTYNDTIRKITSAGVVTTLAGSPGLAGTNNGTGSAARFNTPDALGVGPNTNLYVGDTYNHTIRMITPAGVVTTLAGSPGVSGNIDGTGGTARFFYPIGVAVDPATTNLCVADYGNCIIRQVSPSGVVTTLAGYASGLGTNDGAASTARFNYPAGIVADRASSTLYVVDTYNYTIRTISPAGVVSTLAGSPGLPGTNDGTGNAARFNVPIGICRDAGSNLYVADYFNDTIRTITPAGVVSTLAGSPGLSGTNDGTGSTARFFQPGGVAVDANTNLYVADTFNDTIRMITPAGVVSTFAGSPGVRGTNDGTGGAARFDEPLSVTLNTDGSLIVADSGNQSIRHVTTNGVVTTLAGSPGVSGSTDGSGSAAKFYNPFGVVVDAYGDICEADTYNNAIRKITLAGAVTTFGGSPGVSGSTDGSSADARFDEPEGITADDSGNIYVTDALNQSIRKGYPTLPDVPYATRSYIPQTGIETLLVSNITTTSWSWSIIRQPANSTAQLDSPNSFTTSFTPDVADLYVIRFEGVNAAGRKAVGTVSVVADFTPPTLGITSPTNGQRWSNSVFTVTGTAADDWGVGSVSCQLNNGSWTNAAGTTSWNISFNLTPGTNLIQAFATDLAGNLSGSSSVSLDYVVTAPLVVQTNGHGTLNTNYNGKSLEIGRAYSITAAASAGFAFSNWTGGTSLPLAVLTNGPTLQFLMQPNLILQANFTDVIAPTNTITSPTASQRLTNAVFTAAGTARDNVGVNDVWWQVNGGAWAQAQTTNSWTNWTAILGLPAGTNVFRAYAVDSTGNPSLTNSVTFTETNAFVLSLGLGTPSLTASGLNLVLDASPGMTGRVQVSTNLAAWTTLADFNSTNPPVHLLDATATNHAQQFYRAVSP